MAKKNQGSADKRSRQGLRIFCVSSHWLGEQLGVFETKHIRSARVMFWRSETEHDVRAVKKAKVYPMGANTWVLPMPALSSRTEIAARWVRESPYRGNWPDQYARLINMKQNAIFSTCATAVAKSRTIFNMGQLAHIF